MVDVGIIKIWGKTVGAVRWDKQQKLAYFEYTEEFLKTNWELSPLKMPIQKGQRIFSFPELRPDKNATEDTFKGLPGLLADALPDRYGNQLINAWLAQNGRDVNDLNPIELLCFIGKRGMGALEFEPAQTNYDNQSFAFELNSLIEVAQEMLHKKEDFKTQLDTQQKDAMRDVLKIGTSAGGARPKAVIAYNPKTKEIRSRQANAPKGFEHWLIKLDGVSDAQFGESLGYGRVEMAYYLMAKAAGIEMMECRLLEENGRAHFMTKRFDREGSDTKHHVQTFCAIQHFDYSNLFSYSYEQLFQTMRQLRLSYPEAEQMFRRMVFNVLAINYDDHTKNFSFLLKKDQKWQLSPAYDICFSYAPDNQWVNQHTLSIQGKRKNILREDLLNLAKQINIKNPNQIIADVKSAVSQWNDFAKETGVSDLLREKIGEILG